MRATLVMATALALTAMGACDFNDPDELQNGANFAVIRLQFFESRANRVPVPGVRVVVEAPEDSERPYVGPDVVGISGEDGTVEIKVFPGFIETVDPGGGGGGQDQGSQGPANPLELPPPLIFADVAVTFVTQGQVVPFVTGLTVGSGRLYDLGPVHLQDFGVVN